MLWRFSLLKEVSQKSYVPTMVLGLLSTLSKTFTKKKSIELRYIQLGKPMQNGYIERFNRLVREEVLDAYAFHSLGYMRVLCDRFKEDYNMNHPHQSLCGQSPIRFKYLYNKDMISYDPVKAKMNPAAAGALTGSAQIMTSRLQDIRTEIIT